MPEIQCPQCLATFMMPTHIQGNIGRCPKCGFHPTQAEQNDSESAPFHRAAPHPSQPPPDNPYTNPKAPGYKKPLTPSPEFLRSRVISRVRAPAIGIMIFSCLAISITGLMLYGAIEDFNQGFGENTVVHAGLSFTAMIAHLVCIAGTIQMLQLKSWRLSVGTTLISMLSSPVCLFLPIGFALWGLIVLLDQSTRQQFES